MANSRRKAVRYISVVITALVLMTACGEQKSDFVEEKKVVSTPPTVDEVLAEEAAKADAANSADEATTVDSSADAASSIGDLTADTNSGTAASISPQAPVPDQEAPVDNIEYEGEHDESVDIDLTAMSATMVYSEVFQMMYHPEDYIGKTIKMTGMYDAFHDDATGNDYYACIIMDATACCSQGIEFKLANGEYPGLDTMEVTVKGTFETYEENGTLYCTLTGAELVG